MTRLALAGLFDDGLGPLTAHFEPGVHVLLGEARAQLSRLVELVTGVRKPRAGRVLVDDKSLDRPEHRRLLASLLVNEELLLARDVRTAVRFLLELRRLPLQATDVLDAAGLSDLALRHPHRLDESERQAVALALALADSGASAVVLYDPFGVSPLITRDYLIERCAERARHAAVVIATAQLEDAVALGGNTWLLHRGKLTPSAALAGPHASIEIGVRTPDARRLAALLADEPSISAAAFDDRHGFPELVVKGRDLEAVALAIVTSASRHGIPIGSISPTLPSLQRLALEAMPEPSFAGPWSPQSRALPLAARQP